MPFDIDSIGLTWRVIEGGRILARIIVNFNEIVRLSGKPLWQLQDGLGNNHSAIWATPHISDPDERVDYVVANFPATPAMAPFNVFFPADDPAVENGSTDKVPTQTLPVPYP